MASNKRTHPSGGGGASAARGAPPIHLWDGRDHTHPAGAAAVSGRGVTARGGWAEHVLGGEDASQEVAPLQRRPACARAAAAARRRRVACSCATCW
eukprot:4114479-Prymnesium_polylepis.1